MDAASASSGAVALPLAAAHGRCIARIRLPPGWKKPSSPVRGRCIARVRLPPKWTPEEDARLERLAKENGFGHWHRVARQMMIPRRSPRQCRTRWRDHIARHVYHRPFTAGDDEELRRLVARFGSSGRWKDIGGAVYGRTSRVMKRRWKEIHCNKIIHSFSIPPALPSSLSQDDYQDVPVLQQQDPTTTTTPCPWGCAEDLLASTFASSCSFAVDDPMAGSLALGLACMAL